MRRAKSQSRRLANRQPRNTPLPRSRFIEHVYELRKRMFYIAASILVFGGAAYGVQQQIVNALLRPAKGQHFIYTSPGGGINFLFTLCMYVGVVCSIPMIFYQVLKYLEPLIKKDAKSFIARGSIVSGILAIAGVAFGYFIGLPAAINFLLHQFTSKDITALITIQSYMSFVTMYLAGSALLFQLPLFLLFINRIKPLRPKKLLSYERWVILGAFIAGGIMNPSPRIIDQLMLAGPMIIMYQIGILIIWRVNRRPQSRRHKAFSNMLAEDEKARMERLERRAGARMQFRDPQLLAESQAAVAAIAPAPSIAATPSPAPVAVASRRQPIRRTAPRRHLYVNDFRPAQRPSQSASDSGAQIFA